MNRNEIGGFFELELRAGNEYYPDLISLNSARNALRYIVRVYGITEMYVPYYTCPVIHDALKSESCKLLFYAIDSNLLPVIEFPDDSFILYTNYYGVCTKNSKTLANRYKNLIIDNAQSFYSQPTGLACFYSPRKFFGLPDGGYLKIDKILEEQFEQEISHQRCSHLLKRADLSAEVAYSEFKTNDNSLDNLPIRTMSRFTKKLLCSIDYENAKQKRIENYEFLNENLSNINELNLLDNEIDVPMVYPLLIKNENIRSKLIQNKIYVATYWPEMEMNGAETQIEEYLHKYLLPLPIDQRYREEDMKQILKVIYE